MLFTSATYYLFLVFVLASMVALPWRAGRLVLVAASYFFYGMANPWYCLILLASTGVDFVAARRIHGSNDESHRTLWLRVSLAGNLGLLCLFKYADFGIDNLNRILVPALGSSMPNLDWVLPVGISFYTFQTISYTIDVYRRRIEPTRDFVGFSLYVAFFPQLVAGPIERAARLLPQFTTKPRITHEDIVEGTERILWGLAKKVVFADRLAIMVDTVYSNPSAYSSWELLAATIAFSFQLYLDFSAYTDIAIGSARLMGIRLTENFRYPFLARTPSDFWGRWHMTLTAWFRDYVYQSLGGTRRQRKLRTIGAIFLTMGLMGLWHGAQWHFVSFGLISATVLVGYLALRVWNRGRRLLGDGLGSTIASVAIGNVVIFTIMIFFRADDLPTAWQVLSGIFTNGGGWDRRFDIPLAVLLIAWGLHIVRGAGLHERCGLKARHWPAPLRGAFWAAIVLVIAFGAVERADRFIYFQF
jgi:alginate O-acetyltransferase complex protein AlgI